MKTQKSSAEFEKGLLGFCKIHFALVLIFVAQTIVYDASKLITPEVVLDRWFVIAMLLMINGFIWYFVRSRSGNLVFYKSLLAVMILADIGLASYLVYAGRGFASNGVFLFVVPIIISGLMLSRAALFATAVISVAAYTLTVVSYFVFNFNEGYKVELYGEIGFYSALFLIIASLISVVLHPKK